MSYRPIKDNRLKFNEKKHIYTVDKKVYTSVTTFIKKFFTPFDERTIAKFCARARQAKGENITATQIRKEWKQTAQDGTDTHKVLEEFILNGFMDDRAYYGPKGMAGVSFIIDNIFTNQMLLLPELRIYSERYQVAGTIDLLWFDKSGKAYILDWKTNSKIGGEKRVNKNNNPITADMDDNSLVHYTLQLSTYAYILESEYGISVNDLVIIHLTEDNTKEITIPYMKNTVMEMLEWHKNYINKN